MPRKPKYNPECVAKIIEAIENGDTVDVAAARGGISPTQFYEWQASKPEFAEQVKKARATYDEWCLAGILEDAKRSLKVLICGQEYEEVKTEYESDPKNPGAPRIRKQTRTTKKILPNATAVIFALCNRDSEHWQNRVTNELDGKVQTEAVGSGVSLANVPDELLGKLIDAING